MPSAKPKKNKPVQPVAPVQPPDPIPAPTKPIAPGLKKVYDKLEIEERSINSAKGPITVAWMKKALKWETESEWQKRMVAEAHAAGNADAKPQHFLFGDGVPIKPEDGGGIQPVHCVDMNGEKVICWANQNNRPLDVEWAKAIASMVLYGQWAGPFTVPGGTVNGETIRISEYGRVLSAQHQGTGLIFAAQILAKARADGIDHADSPRYPTWVKHGEPFIESVVIKGLSEDPRILMTVDYLRPRTAADVFYTSPVYGEANPGERRELCKMLASAVDTLWTRTKALGYRTHPEVIGFLERHKKLLKCVEYLFQVNSAKSNRRISRLHLQAGMCAAINYLMGSSATSGDDSDAYRNMEPAPSEKVLDWSLWDRAEEFWDMLAAHADFDPVRQALYALERSKPNSEDNQGMGGNTPEKLALLAAAWGRWREHSGNGKPFDKDDLKDGGDLCLSYNDKDDKGNVLPDGKIKLLDIADFLGIDCPETTKTKRAAGTTQVPDPPAPTREEIAEMAEALRLKREQQPKK